MAVTGFLFGNTGVVTLPTGLLGTEANSDLEILSWSGILSATMHDRNTFAQTDAWVREEKGNSQFTGQFQAFIIAGSLNVTDLAAFGTVARSATSSVKLGIANASTPLSTLSASMHLSDFDFGEIRHGEPVIVTGSLRSYGPVTVETAAA